MSRLALFAVAVGVVALQGGEAGGAIVATRGLPQLVGRRLVVAMDGTAPSAGLLNRIRRGEVGGVILFGTNVRDEAQVRKLVSTLRSASRSGGHGRLIVAVDQEGGRTRRFSWAPPFASAAQLGRRSADAVRAEGRATGRALRALGIDVDLAPVADVPAVPGSFIAEQERAFSTDPSLAADRATAFALGLADASVAATAKHFPGLGRATSTTDVAAQTITASRAQLRTDLVPFRSLVAAGVPLVMVSSAVYPSLDPKPATWSLAVQALLRNDLRFKGVTITDALEPAARTHGRSVASAAILAAQAGVDLILLAGDEEESAAVFDRMVAAARDGRLSLRSLERSNARIVALDRRLSAPA